MSTMYIFICQSKNFFLLDFSVNGDFFSLQIINIITNNNNVYLKVYSVL